MYTISDYDDLNMLIEMFMRKSIPKLCHMYIETTNFCNYTCSFCPVGQGKRNEEKHIMTFEFFQNLVDMFSKSSLTRNVKISLYGNNEPLLDPTIVSKINYLKEKLPDTYVYISTNGLLLDSVITELYESKLNCLYIQAYTEDIYNHVINLLQQKNYAYEVGSYTTSATSKIYIVPRYDSTYSYTLINRAGQAYSTSNIPNTRCICPFVDFHVDSFGNILMCTFDSLCETKFDNVLNYTTFEDIWFSKKYTMIRMKMLQLGKYGFDVCKKCDIPNNRYRLSFYLKNLEVS